MVFRKCDDEGSNLVTSTKKAVDYDKVLGVESLAPSDPEPTPERKSDPRPMQSNSLSEAINFNVSKANSTNKTQCLSPEAIVELETSKFNFDGVSKGDILGDFRVIERLGCGATASVWRGENVFDKTPVALKVLTPLSQNNTDDGLLERFLFEGKILGLNLHDRIVASYGSGISESGSYFIATALCKEDAASLLSMSKGINVESALSLIYSVSEALDALWSHRIIHRDIKLHNILLDHQKRVYLSDFGTAKKHTFDHQFTQLGKVIATPSHAPPERMANNQADHRSDIYSLGVCLFELIAGQHPFDCLDTKSMTLAHKSTPIPPLSKVMTSPPEGVSSLIRKMCQKKPEDRFQSYSELQDAIKALSYFSLANYRRNPSIDYRPPSLSNSLEGIGEVKKTVAAHHERDESGPKLKPKTSRKLSTPKVKITPSIASVTKVKSPTQVAPSNNLSRSTSTSNEINSVSAIDREEEESKIGSERKIRSNIAVALTLLNIIFLSYCLLTSGSSMSTKLLIYGPITFMVLISKHSFLQLLAMEMTIVLLRNIGGFVPAEFTKERILAFAIVPSILSPIILIIRVIKRLLKK